MIMKKDKNHLTESRFWTLEEMDYLKEAINKKVLRRDMAKKLNRSITSIYSKVREIQKQNKLNFKELCNNEGIEHFDFDIK